MDTNKHDSFSMEKDAYDKYMEPFKYLEQISESNRKIFNELLRYTNENIHNEDDNKV
ncbi:MAG: hypothetical protein ACOZCL_03135 [Bacillota bacterium]